MKFILTCIYVNSVVDVTMAAPLQIQIMEKFELNNNSKYATKQ